MGVKEEIHAQIVRALAGADFPIETPEALWQHFQTEQKPPANQET